MKITVALTPSGVTDGEIKEKSVIVLSVLRTCSTIVTALAHGAKAVLPAATLGDAGRMASNLDHSVYLLGGEKNGEAIEGYHLSNSPLEYTPEKVRGRSIILHTSTATETIVSLRNAKTLLLGSFLNAKSIIEYLRGTEEDAIIVCSGTQHRISIADTLCAGYMVHLLWRGNRPKYLSDGTLLAHEAFLATKNKLQSFIENSGIAQDLASKGFGDDIPFCTTLDKFSVLPYFNTNTLGIIPFHPNEE